MIASKEKDPVRTFLAQLEREHRTEARLEARTNEAFRLARVDDRTKHFQPPHRSGDAAIHESWPMMTARVREEFLNNAQFKKAVGGLKDLVIGPGLMTFSSPFDPWMDLSRASLADFDEGFRFALEADDWFEEWAGDPKQCDVEGKKALFDMQALSFSEMMLSGDALLVECRRHDPGQITPLCYQMIEREQLDTTKDRPAAPGQNKIIGGIELDDSNREVAFHVFDAHPFDDFTPFSSSSKSSRISAKRVIHLFSFLRPSQSMGATWLSAMGQTSLDRDRFLGAELQTAIKAALLALIVKRENPSGGSLSLDDGTTAEDEFGNAEIVLGSTTLGIDIGLKDSVDLVESTRPNSTLAPFVDVIDHDSASAVEMSYYRFTGRYEKSSYTSVRGAHLDDDAHVKPMQNWFGRKCAIPIRQRFNAMAAASGRYKTVTPSQFLKDLRRYQRFDAIGAGRELLDPEGETESAISKLRSGLTTLKIECAKRQLHWIKVLRQIAMENRVCDLLGVVLDHTKGQGGQTEGNTRSARHAGESRQETRERIRSEEY